MGFPSFGRGIPMPKLLLDLLELVDYIKFMIMLALFYLGLYVPSDHTTSWEDHMYRLSSTDLPSSLVPLTVMMQPTVRRPDSIKKRLPIVKFGEFIERSGIHKEDSEPVCAVCLSGLERFDEMRELCSCAHAFHVGCLDKWLDQGHMTCPLCRSKLLDEGDEVKGCGGDFWVAEGISYFFGDDLVMGGF